MLKGQKKHIDKEQGKTKHEAPRRVKPGFFSSKIYQAPQEDQMVDPLNSSVFYDLIAAYFRDFPYFLFYNFEDLALEQESCSLCVFALYCIIYYYVICVL